MKTRYYPLAIWSLLYISIIFATQGSIGVYGTVFADISELAKYEPRYFTSIHKNWAACWINFSLYLTLFTVFLCGITVQKYKGRSNKRLVDWVSVLVGVVSVSSMVNGLSIWSYGFISWGSLHTHLIKERPCCFAGRAAFFDLDPRTQKRPSHTLVTCVCSDFSECFTDQPSSECSKEIEARVAAFCVLLQFMQYSTTIFALVEVVLISYALVMICKANSEHPINEKKFRTWDEYKSLKETLRAEKMARREQVSTLVESNYDENTPAYVDRNFTEVDDRASYGYGVSSHMMPPDRVIAEEPQLGPHRMFATIPSQKINTRWSGQADGSYPNNWATQARVASPPQLDEGADPMASDVNASSASSSELRQYLRNTPSMVSSEHTADSFSRSYGGGYRTGRLHTTQSAIWEKHLKRSQSLQPYNSTEIQNMATMNDPNNPGTGGADQRKLSRDWKGVIGLMKDGDKIPRVSLGSIPKNLNSTVCAKCAAHHKNHRHNQPDDMHGKKTNVTQTRDYKETKRREIESARKAVGKR